MADQRGRRCCRNIVQENDILNSLIPDQRRQSFRIITVIHDINRFIMVNEEWNKGVAKGFFNDNTGASVTQLSLIGWSPPMKQLYFEPASQSDTSWIIS